jgi:hypothetical protein
VTATTAPKRAQLAQDSATIEAFARALGHARWGCAEVRVLGSPAKIGRDFIGPGTHAGFFADPAKIAPAVRAWGSGHADCGVYISANPYPRDFMARADHRLKRAKKDGGDCGTMSQVAQLVNLVLDFDPARPTGIPATEAERLAAIEARDVARERLDELGVSGWSGMSGNGAYLVLPTPGYANTPENRETWARLLDGFVAVLSRASVKVDEKLKDPSRIVRLLGTVNSKGDGSAERPWRVSTFDEPGTFEPADLIGRAGELLKALGAPAPAAVEIRRPVPPGPPRTPPPVVSDAPARNGGPAHGPGYEDHWRAIGARVVELVQELGPRVPPAGDRVELACPACGREAWIGLQPGKTPHLRCKHENSCKLDERLSDYLKRTRGLATDREVLELLAGLSGLAPPRRARMHGLDAAGAALGAARRKARDAFAALPEGVDTWRWVGWEAERRGVGAEAVELAPQAYRADVEKGREAARAETKVGRPTPVERLVKAAQRALDTIAAPPEDERDEDELGDLEVLRIVHHQRPQSRGGDFDLTIRFGSREATLRGVTGDELRSYARVAGRAMSVRLNLPAAPKNANRLWLELLGDLEQNVEVREVPQAAEADVAAQDAIRNFLRHAQRGMTGEELERGAVLEDQARPSDGLAPRVERVLLAAARHVLGYVKKVMPDDGLSRAEVLGAAGHLGAVERKRYLPCGDRRTVLVFPVDVLSEDDEEA